MHFTESKRQKDLGNILSAIKMVSLLFGVILVLSQDDIQKNIMLPDGSLDVSSGMTAFIAFLFFAAYFLWHLFSTRISNPLHYKRMQIIENFCLVALFSILIVMTNPSATEYKFLFIFIIIISTLQSGMKSGMAVAVTSSILILAIDLYASQRIPVNPFFEKDLILAGVFISIAAALGHYVRIEEENMALKNLHLQELNNEILEKDNQRKYIEKILFNNEVCYNMLFRNSGNAVIVHRDNEIIFANESASKLIGTQSNEELAGKHLLDSGFFEDKQKLEECLQQLYSESINMVNFEGKLLRIDGQALNVQSSSARFMYEGRVTILSIINDITSNKQVEKLKRDVEKNIELLNETLEVNRMITEFFSNISHELKTPLNVIFSALQVLELHINSDVDSADKDDKYISIMKQNCYRLLRLINNLLDLTRVDSGFLKLNPENHNIVSLIEEISLSVVSYLESKEISLIFDTNTEERIIAVDPDKIERIILNLLSNACKFTKPGGEISVCLTDMEDNIVISVKDTGIGIPEDKLEFIFERFGQVDKTLRRSHEGSGIGLSLVKSFVEMHGGSIQVRSEVGAGSEFIITLPAVTLVEEFPKDAALYENNIERISIEFSDIYSDFM